MGLDVYKADPETDQEDINRINAQARTLLSQCPPQTLDDNISALIKVLALQLYVQYTNFGHTELDNTELDAGLDMINKILEDYIINAPFKDMLDNSKTTN
jgi:hypothetical protein